MALIAEGQINITGGFQTNLIAVNRRGTYLIPTRLFVLNQISTSGVVVQVGPSNVYQHNFSITGDLESSGLEFDSFFPSQDDLGGRTMVSPQAPLYLCTNAVAPVMTGSFFYQLYGIYVGV